MNLEVDFCPLLARIQGYLLQFLKEDEGVFKDELAESVDQFTVHLTQCIAEEGSDPASLQSLHDLLLASSGLTVLEPTCPHVQSALAVLGGASVPAALYLAALPAGLQPALLRRLRDSARPDELRAALVSACCRPPVYWPAVPVVLCACLQTSDSAESELQQLTATLATATDTSDGTAALALTTGLLTLLEHLLETQPPAAAVVSATGSVVGAATALFRRVTLNEWLQWAEQEAAPGGPSLQAAVAETLRDVTEVTEEASLEQRADLPTGTTALLQTVQPYAGRESLSRQQRLRLVTERGKRCRRHFRALLDEFDVADAELVRCLEESGDLISTDDLWKLLEVVKASAGQASDLRDRVIKVLVAELLKEPASEQRRRLVEHVLNTAPDISCSTWEQDVRMASAQLVGTEGDTVTEASCAQLSCLLLQSARPLLRSVVQQTAESGGKAAIMSALLSALQQRLPLHLLSADIETLIVEQLSVTAELKPFRQLVQLLTAAVSCELVTVDVRLVQRLTELQVPRRFTLHLVQELLTSSAVRSADWCCHLAQFAAVALDQTLDMDTEAEAMVEQRQVALHCIRLMEDDNQLDCDGALSALARRCHPLTERYLCRYLLGGQPAADHEPLLRCLTDDTAPPWRADDHTLIKATLASYLPYLCEDEWRRLHSCLLEYCSGSAPLVGPAPADQRPLARSVWYYGDLVTLWTTAVDGVPAEESLLLPADRLAVCLRAIAVQIKRSLEHLASGEQYGDELSAVFLPLTHLMTLLADPAVRQPLDMLALFVTAEFIKQLTARAEQKGSEQPPAGRETPASPCMDWELQQMDTSAGTLSQFVVGCFNIPNDSPIKKRVLQHISGSVLGSLTPQPGVAG